MKKYLLLAIMLFNIQMIACSKSKSPGLPAPIDSTFRHMPFHMGASLNISLLKNNAQYRALAAKEFKSLTAENAMKMAALQPTQGNFNWADADYLINFSSQNTQRVHGHTLLWHQSLPAWLQNYTGDSATLENILKTHIQTVVTHFKGKVVSWDVVNEAFEDNGTLRNSLWRQKLGADYVARCFTYAHEADPDAKLFYNDYGHEYSATKRAAIINFVNGLKSRGIPIHGIGLQMHTRYSQPTANLAEAINTAAGTGLLVHISELDIALNPDNVAGLVLTPAMAALQADAYKFIVKTYYAIPAAQQFGITTWNVTDADSWLRSTYNRPDWPLPFDDNYQRKPAYFSILSAVR